MTEPMKYVTLNDRDKAIIADYVDLHVTDADIRQLYDDGERQLFYKNLQDHYMDNGKSHGSANLDYVVPKHEPTHYSQLDARRFIPIGRRTNNPSKRTTQPKAKEIAPLPEPAIPSSRRRGSNAQPKPPAIVRAARSIGRFFRRSR